MKYNLEKINLLEKLIKKHFYKFSDDVQKRAIKILIRMRAAGKTNPSRRDVIFIDDEKGTTRYVFDNFMIDEDGVEKKAQKMTTENPNGDKIVVTPKGIEECQVVIRNQYPVLRNEKEVKENNALLKRFKLEINDYMNKILDKIASTNVNQDELFQDYITLENISSDIDDASISYVEHLKRLHYDTSLTITDILIPHGISNLSVPGFKKLEGSDYLVREIKEADPKAEINQDETLYEIEDYYDLDYNKISVGESFIPLDKLFYKNNDLKRALTVYKARHGYDFTPTNHYMPPRQKNHQK